MKLSYDCIPCLIRQAVDIARKVTDNTDIQEDIIKHALNEASHFDDLEVAPGLSRAIQMHVKKVTKNNDPYKQLKIQFNRDAKMICRELQLDQLVKDSLSPINTACRCAIAGNIIDFVAVSSIDKHKIRSTVMECLDTEIQGQTPEDLLESAKKANKILYLGDNAGEIVFDQLLINELPKEKITYVVKGAPIVNDATMEDAIEVGMTEMVRVIDNGSDAQGTIMNTCSKVFKMKFEEADLIISKGQANYETLSEMQDKEIYFLLKAKCKPIADDLKCTHGDFVIKRHLLGRER
ncbi:damage-control phosphatase ARMT1 family protein [Vallitalea okinawensis]|uniref:damage-control phosphatase ARMT1 family protein n=1 Tax=Vallitalea okinawensis TaxID=2078660 RepID=UPI000CFE1704|nr:ARMT1-like domain-containing protein [Vallitalea okinawensis]